ncbi:chaplin [Streptomyces pathocidini]|uniref:Chaplin n=1 Tax=Streptomyces pathocidini TaxID=1650571 RepID=A0ABW7UV92_9ACTN
MKRIARAATLTAASCALIVGGAGAAVAENGYGGGGGEEKPSYEEPIHRKPHKKEHKQREHREHRENHKKYYSNERNGDQGTNAAVLGSPGFLSGNAIQTPVSIPINLCGNTVDVIAALNPAFGNTCANVSGGGSGREGYGAHKGNGHKGNDNFKGGNRH